MDENEIDIVTLLDIVFIFALGEKILRILSDSDNDGGGNDDAV